MYIVVAPVDVRCRSTFGEVGGVMPSPMMIELPIGARVSLMKVRVAVGAGMPSRLTWFALIVIGPSKRNERSIETDHSLLIQGVVATAPEPASRKTLKLFSEQKPLMTKSSKFEVVMKAPSSGLVKRTRGPVSSKARSDGPDVPPEEPHEER